MNALASVITQPAAMAKRPGKPAEVAAAEPVESVQITGVRHVAARGVEPACTMISITGPMGFSGTLILLRHGESLWNLEGKFSGQGNPPLTPKGVQGARHAGALLQHIKIDAAFTSVLDRAVDTNTEALHAAGQPNVPTRSVPELNERGYGVLTGQVRAEMARIHGDHMVELWRHDYHIVPQGGESIKQCADRVIPFFEAEILPLLQAGKTVLVTAHCDSLRAIDVYLQGLQPDGEVAYIPNCVPIVFRNGERHELR